MGINLTKYRTLSFGLAAFAGVGGALYAHYNQVVSNEGFGIDRSIIFLAMIIIGGLGSIMGTLMGTAFMVLLPESMEWLSVALRGSPIDQFLGLKNNIAFLREMAIGIIIIVFLVFEPDGLRIAGGRSRRTGNSTRSRIEVGTGRTIRRPREATGGLCP